MGWKPGELWLDTDMLWFRETRAALVPAVSFPSVLAPPPWEPIPRSARATPSRRSLVRRVPALALVLGSAVTLPLAGQREGTSLDALRALWEDPPSQELRLDPRVFDVSVERATGDSVSVGLGVAAFEEAFEHHPNPLSLVDWRRATSTGLPFSGRLENGTQLPVVGPGWVTWNPVTDSSPNLPRRLYGHQRTIKTIVEVVTAYRLAHPEAPPVVIGDISYRGGGRMDEHVSHQNGLDVDVYYPRRDRVLKAPVMTSQVDRRLAQDLLDRFVAAGARMIFVGYSTGLAGSRSVVIPYPNHENHMHVRFPAP